MTPDPQEQTTPKASATEEASWSVDDLALPRGAAAFGVEPYVMAGALTLAKRKTLSEADVKKLLDVFAKKAEERDDPGAQPEEA